MKDYSLTNLYTSADVAYIVLLAGPGQPSDELLLLQTALCGKASGGQEADIVRTQSMMKKVFVILKQETDSAVIQTKFQELAVNIYNDMSNPSPKILISFLLSAGDL